jgi:two-component system, NtrC family, nitrogen regulation sensor histidine kinase NtrY
VILSLALLSMALYFIFRLLKSRQRGDSGNRLRFRLVGYFLAVVLLASAPQALLFWRAVSSVAEAWFNARIERAIEGGERLSLDYAEFMRSDLEGVATEEMPSYAERYLPSRVDALMARMRRSHPRLVSIQAFAYSSPGTLAEIYFSGTEEHRISENSARLFGEGELPSVTVDSSYALRYLKEIQAGGTRYAVVLSAAFPDSWTGISEDIHAAAKESRNISAGVPRYRSLLLLLYAIFALPLILASILFALSASDSVVKPIMALERATSRVAEGDFGVRLLTRAQDDFAALITSFNRMVGELQRFRTAILQAEKINVWQDIAQKLAHEIKNPLTPIKLSAERVLKRHRADPAGTGEILEPAMVAIIQEVDGLSSLLSEFRDFARLPEPQFEWTDLRDVAGEVARSYASSHPRVAIDVSGVPAGTTLRADRGHLRQAFMNLFINAIEAMSGEGRIDVRSDLVKRSDSSYCRIQVRDTGPGVPEGIRDRLFSPYFTTKESGTGLGLSIVEHIVIDHKGEVWFETEAGAGTTFFIDLPVDEPRGAGTPEGHAHRSGR